MIRSLRPALLAAVAALPACTPRQAPLAPLDNGSSADAGVAAPRRNSEIGGSDRTAPAPTISEVPSNRLASPHPPRSKAAADITFDFVDTDIREIVSTVLGRMLEVPYTMDPGITGTATLHTTKPLSRDEALSYLRTVLAANGAVLIEADGLWQVLTAANAANRPFVGSLGDAEGTAEAVTLRYASAKQLARLIQPFVAHGGKVVEDDDHNALIVLGDPLTRATLADLIRSFDTDLLAGQSYALFPVTSGTPAKVATELQKILLAEPDHPLAGQIRVIAMPRINAVLVASSQQRFINDARRLIQLVDHAAVSSKPSWHIYYVQNGQSTDLENVLQRAFTPDHVTGTGASDTNRITTAPGLHASSQSSGGAGGSGAGTGGSGGLLGNLAGTDPLVPPGGGDNGAAASGAASAAGAEPAALEPLSSGGGAQGGGEGASEDRAERIRIIANRRNNALLIYAPPDDYATIEAMLQKIDIVPLQVRIDATIVEVDLTNKLQYGTQFFFKHGGLAGELNNAPATTQTATPLNLLGPGDLTNTLQGFTLDFASHSVSAALDALKDVTQIKVLSSPQISVLDNEAATIEVGDEVPIQTQSLGTATVSATTPSILNSTAYRQTGVVLQVVPRVNSSGLVALDLAQEISDPIATSSSTIQSPTFQNRLVQSRVVVQDGQTFGVAGLIRDNDTRENSGLPFLKDIPVLGTLFGGQNNSRVRTELLVLITPHVIYDQRGARMLTEDLRAELNDAARVPGKLGSMSVGASADPNGVLGH